MASYFRTEDCNVRGLTIRSIVKSGRSESVRIDVSLNKTGVLSARVTTSTTGVGLLTNFTETTRDDYQSTADLIREFVNDATVHQNQYYSSISKELSTISFIYDRDEAIDILQFSTYKSENKTIYDLRGWTAQIENIDFSLLGTVEEFHRFLFDSLFISL